MPRALWIADRCRAFGLTVVEVDGWRTRGKESFNPGGVVAHHTADGAGEMPSLRVLINGRSDLPGPLCQVGLARSGAVYVVAAGRANHAGRGGWRGLVGNSSVLGIEAENKGGAGDKWPAKQVDAYHALAAALITGPGVGGDVRNICGHKEWTTRKPDPHTIDMSAFRFAVSNVIAGGQPEQEDEMTESSFDLRAGEEILIHLPPADLVRSVWIGSPKARVFGAFTNAGGKNLAAPLEMMLDRAKGKGFVGGEITDKKAVGAYYQNEGPGIVVVTVRSKRAT